MIYVANMVKKFDIKIKLFWDVWYLDLYTLKYLISNNDLFIDDFYPKYINFLTIKKKILQTKSIITIAISFFNRHSLKLYNIAYVLNYDTNFNLSNQFYDSNITYVNHFNVMILT